MYPVTYHAQLIQHNFTAFVTKKLQQQNNNNNNGKDKSHIKSVIANTTPQPL